MSYNTKNYTEQGGDVTHFGGKVIFEEGAEVEGLPAPTPEIELATEDTIGGIYAEEKGEGDTVKCKIGEDGNLYVPTYPTPSGGGRLVCVFTFIEDTETWECDQTAEAIKAAFANHDVVDAYYHEGDANIFKMSLCFATTAKIEFKSHISNLYANWENNAWVVHLPE